MKSAPSLVLTVCAHALAFVLGSVRQLIQSETAVDRSQVQPALDAAAVAALTATSPGLGACLALRSLGASAQLVFTNAAFAKAVGSLLAQASVLVATIAGPTPPPLVDPSVHPAT